MSNAQGQNHSELHVLTPGSQVKHSTNSIPKIIFIAANNVQRASHDEMRHFRGIARSFIMLKPISTQFGELRFI